MFAMKNIFSKSETSLKDSIEEVIEEQESSSDSISNEEKSILRNVVSFSEMEVSEVMIPRADFVSVEVNTNFEQIKKIFQSNIRTRMPVYKTNIDDIVGFLHIKDLLAEVINGKKPTVKELVRPALFVPHSMKTSTLLMKMQADRIHMAFVIDEYGGTSGLVTLENLMEIIVGEIEDEHDDDDDAIIYKVSDNVFDSSARVEIEEVEEVIGCKLEVDAKDDDFETLGGFIYELLGRIPTVGEVAVFEPKKGKKIEFEITEADPRKINKITIRT